MQTPDGIEESLWKKILAIRDLADPERGATQGEIEAATAKLNKLLLEHNLSLAMLESGPITNINHRIFQTDIEAVTWEMALLKVLADQNFCRVIADTSRRVFCIVGKDHNITATWETYMWLGPKIMAVGIEARDAEQRKPRKILSDSLFSDWIEWPPRENIVHEQPARWLNSYLMGMVSGIEKSMKKARKETLAQNDNRAMVPVLDKEVDDYVRDNFQVESKPLNFSAEEDIYRAGQEAGRHIDLYKREEITS